MLEVWHKLSIVITVGGKMYGCAKELGSAYQWKVIVYYKESLFPLALILLLLFLSLR